jgi:hypothetical protein
MDELLWARLRDKRPSSGVLSEKLAEKPPVERPASYQNMIDQGLRLHKAFRNISNAALREAVVTLVIELARSEISD